MTELKPCPFCGKTETLRVRDSGSAWVTCYGCKTDGPYCESKEEAINMWNARAEYTLRARVEKLETDNVRLRETFTALLEEWESAEISVIYEFSGDFDKSFADLSKTKANWQKRASDALAAKDGEE